MEFVWPTSHIGMLHPASSEQAARDRSDDFKKLAEASVSRTSYKDAKLLLSCSKNQAETRKSLFEELGLLYVPYRSNQIELTPVGRQLFETISEKSGLLESKDAQRVDTLLLWAMVHSQINRPQSFGSPQLSPLDREACDIRPYATAWKLMTRLGGRLSVDELMGRVRRMRSLSDFDDCLAEILQAREEGRLFVDPSELWGRTALMNARIYWSSHLSGAYRFLAYDEEAKVFRFQPGVLDTLETIFRFDEGCDRDIMRPLHAQSWTSSGEYFERIGGKECPTFLASGRTSVVEFDGLSLVILRNYQARSEGSRVIIRGGPELCSLPIKSACFHRNSPERLLRIDAKHGLPSGEIEIVCGFGRPIVEISRFQSAIADHEGGDVS